ncbi:hypothetical protein [Photobacterium marinum]|uniref:hypothetical protein n=1 Tax=Photobacterium marinum TaxID=1056511 RepID=UPI00056B5C9C|nr:hypothetical protein [Photobacterium marinum]
MKKYLYLLFVIFPSVTFGELSDKTPSYGSFWLTSIIIGLLFLVASYKLRYFHYFGLLVTIFMFLGVYDLYSEPSFRNSVMDEKGEWYFYHGYISSLQVFILSVIGRVLSKMKPKRNS